jgi:hypothetical protein
MIGEAGRYLAACFFIAARNGVQYEKAWVVPYNAVLPISS